MSDSLRSDHVWALVLAGGDGNRLKSLTTTADGVAVPKQYCSLHGGQTLLDNALSRAEAVVDKQKIYTVVAAQHREWWQTSLDKYAAKQIVVQPKNRGTAIGIMLPLLHILKHDPQARVFMLPSDHHVRDEPTISDALRQASGRLSDSHDKIVILGIEPEEADSELGYILPGKRLGDGASTVASFVEKPPQFRAHQLLAQGALWNTFIVAAKVHTLLNLFAQRCPGILEEMREVIIDGKYEASLQSLLLHELYTRLPTLDFSRDILPGFESELEVLTVPFCGWTDLGTPRRVREVLHRWPDSTPIPASSESSGSVTLAAHANFIVNKTLSQLPRLPVLRES